MLAVMGRSFFFGGGVMAKEVEGVRYNLANFQIALFLELCLICLAGERESLCVCVHVSIPC